MTTERPASSRQGSEMRMSPSLPQAGVGSSLDRAPSPSPRITQASLDRDSGGTNPSLFSASFLPTRERPAEELRPALEIPLEVVRAAETEIGESFLGQGEQPSSDTLSDSTTERRGPVSPTSPSPNKLPGEKPERQLESGGGRGFSARKAESLSLQANTALREGLRVSLLERGLSEENVAVFFEFADFVNKAISSPPREWNPRELELPTASHPERVEQHLLSVAGPIDIRDPRHGAVHGTSIEVVKSILAYGVVPGLQSDLRDPRTQNGDISFYPTPALFNASSEILSPYGVDRVTKNISESQADAVSYAAGIAKCHSVLSMLGIPLSERERYMEEITELLHDTAAYPSDLRELGMSIEGIMRLKQTALSRKGFLVGFSPQIFTEEGISFEEGEGGDADLTIRTAEKGLRYGLISGIQALGPQEEAFLASLRRINASRASDEGSSSQIRGQNTTSFPTEPVTPESPDVGGGGNNNGGRNSPPTPDGESEEPFDLQRRLGRIGVTPQEIEVIRTRTSAERRGRSAMKDDEADFLYGVRAALYSGDYQQRLHADLGFSERLDEGLNRLPPYLEIPTETPVRKGFPLRKRTEIKRGKEIKDLQPVVDITQEIASYVREVSTRGEHPVTIVDFGAGAAITVSALAHLLKDDIKAGKVRIIATSIDKVPTINDIPTIRRKSPPEHAENVIEALLEHTANYVQADIIELYELLKGEPIHLLFMMETLALTWEYNEPLLKIVKEMLHPQYGTAMVSFEKGYSASPQQLPPIRRGLNGLVQAGFRSIHPLQVAEGTVHPRSVFDQFRIEVYQGSDAPSLPLYTI